MTKVTTKNIIRWTIILVSLAIVSLIQWNIFIFFQRFKDEERNKMEILASAYQRLINNTDLNSDITLENQILDSNTNIPMIATDAQGHIVFHRNLNPDRTDESDYLKHQLSVMKDQNKSIIIDYMGQSRQYIYYSDSTILTKLKYFPFGLVFILILFAIALYLYNHNNRIAAQNKLWTGMAKETAHQIGTPLTSLMGWIALLKEDLKTEPMAIEMEKDVNRLDVIANRFSKIGSNPVLYQKNIVSVTNDSLVYLKSRASKKVSFSFNANQDHIQAQINPELYGWVLENLIKNALDAIKGEGVIDISMTTDQKKVYINVCDDGKGIPKSQHKRIFEPGFTTKKRGWGLGLSLSKRIIEDFHGGNISVLKSEINKGTCFQIVLNITEVGG